MVSAETDHTINQNWFVSGLLQVITDSSSEPTTGNITVYDVEPFATTSDSGESSGADVDITVLASRSLHIESTVVTGSGEVTHVVWTQKMAYSNHQAYRDNTLIQVRRLQPPVDLFNDISQNVTQTATGEILSTHNGRTVVSDSFSYPLQVSLTFGSTDFSNCTDGSVLAKNYLNHIIS